MTAYPKKVSPKPYRLFRIRRAVVKLMSPMPASAQTPKSRTTQFGAARWLASAVPSPPTGQRSNAAAHKRRARFSASTFPAPFMS